MESPLRRHQSGHSIAHQKQNDSSLLQTRVNSLGPIGVNYNRWILLLNGYPTGTAQGPRSTFLSGGGGGGAKEERVEFFFLGGGHAWEFLFDFSEVTENASAV